MAMLDILEGFFFLRFLAKAERKGPEAKATWGSKREEEEKEEARGHGEVNQIVCTWQ